MKTEKNEKSFIWTKDKINDLISLYQTSECLWNILTDDYKSREKRDAAISLICDTLDITREQFSKKIHNLRNQFNYEAKKIRQRSDFSNNLYRSKWEYYDKLLFLKNVIASKSTTNYVLGDYEIQSSSNSEVIRIETIKTDESQPEIVHIIDTKTGEIDHNTIVYEEKALIQLNNSQLEAQAISNNTNNKYHKTIQETQNAEAEIIQQNPKQNIKEEVQTKAIKRKNQQRLTIIKNRKKQIPEKDDNKNYEIIESPSNTNNNNTTLSPPPPKKIIKRNSSVGYSYNNSVQELCDQQQEQQQSEIQQSQNRDEYQLLGKFIANELRNLNHDVSRKKLKRRIMQAMLETANEDDELD